MMAQEIEIKLIGSDASVVKGAFELPLIKPLVKQGPETTVLKTSYIDTPDLDLAKGNFAFRIRMQGNQWKATIKRGRGYSKGLYVRDEWEVDIPHPMIDFDVFQDADLIRTMKELVKDKQLIVLFEVFVNRTGGLLILQDGTQIELVIDEGEIQSYGLKEPILELEMELTSGNREQLVSLSESLKKNYALKEGAKSKYARGLTLFQRASKMEGIGEFLADVEGFEGLQ